MAIFTEKETLTLSVKSPPSLRTVCLYKTSVMLFQLNNIDMGCKFPWLKSECNPFFTDIPVDVIVDIVQDLQTLMENRGHEMSRGEGQPLKIRLNIDLLKILYCKKFTIIDTSKLIPNHRDSIEALKTIEATHSDVRILRLNTKYDLTLKRWPRLLLIISTLSHCLRMYHFRRSHFYLLSYLPTLTWLTRFTLIGLCDERITETLGVNCPHLVSFETEEIVGRALQNLCIDKNYSRRCQKMEEIYFRRYPLGMTLTEDVEKLLKYLPRLRVLDTDYTVIGSNLVKLQKQYPKYTCCLENYEFMDGNDACISAIAKTCPFMKNLTVHEATNETLVAFGELQNLKKVKIYKRSDFAAFEDRLRRFLQNVGQNLQILEIIYVDVVDLNILDNYCPHLKMLGLYGCQLTVRLEHKLSFSFLEILTLSAAIGRGMEADVFVELLAQCHNLTSLKIDCCYYFNKNHLKEIMLSNPLENLRTLSISSSYMSIEGNSDSWGRILREL